MLRTTLISTSSPRSLRKSLVRRTIAIAGVAVLVVLSSSSAGLAQIDPPNPKYGGTAVVAIPADPPHFNGAVSTSNHVNMVTSVMQDSLILQDRDGKILPLLAESWESSDNSRTWTFKLVRNAKWHDGVPFTSADVKFTAEKIWKVTHSRNRSVLRNLISVETPDQYTAAFKFSEPIAGLLTSLGKYEGAIAAKHVFDSAEPFTVGHPRNTDRPIGTGPFKFEEWVKGSHVSFVKNPDFWRKGQPYLDKVIFRIIPDGGARALALEAGEVDFIQATSLPSFAEINRLRNSKGVVVNDTTFASIPVTMGIMFNLDRAPSNKLPFRQALAHAIDRQFLVDNIVQGLGTVANGPFSAPWYDDAAVVKYPRDMTKAGQLLDQAGYPRGANGVRLSIKLHFDQSRASAARAAEAVREQLIPLGVDIQLAPMDSATMEQTLFIKRDFEISIPAEFVGVGPDPTVGIRAYHHTSQIGQSLYNNAPGWRNATFDKAIDDAAAIADVAERKKLFSVAQQEITKDLPWLWLIHANRPNLYRDVFTNVKWSDVYQIEFGAVHLTPSPSEQAPVGTPVSGTPLNPLIPVAAVAVLVLAGGLLFIRRRA
jgi:peptide/nickel transport system substrate-binding protein